MSNTEKKVQQPLHPPDRPRRQSNSACRCLLWTSGAIALVITGFVGYLLYLFLQTFYETLAYPHQSLYQNQSLSEVSNRSLVVQPLIGKDQTFDLAVSVWIRAPKAEEEEWRDSLGEYVDPGLDSGEPLRFLQKFKKSAFSDNQFTIPVGFDEAELLQGEKKHLYHPLYSNIAFRGLHLSDKGVSASINFTVPTEKFREPKLKETDLYGAVVLIPTSPSPMNFVVNYSTWIPDEVVPKLAPDRTWPFPMGFDYDEEKSIIDLALESFSATIPLLQFHKIPSRCPDNATEVESNTDSDEDGILVDVHGNADFSSIKRKLKAQEDAKAAKHPHIATWSQIRIIEETHIMNLEAYDKAHENLKKTSCGQDLKANRPIKPISRLCTRDYTKTGILETKLQLEMKDLDGNIHNEWAYAPFITYLPHTSGPMDLIPIPVDRENCTDKLILDQDTNRTSNFSLAEADSLDITWHISFSGRTLTKAYIGGLLGSPSAMNHSQSDYDRFNQQNKVELWNGLRGVSKPNSHPRRRFALSTLTRILPLVTYILTLVYWYTRNNTIYISIPGTILTVMADIFLQIYASLHVYSQRSGDISEMLQSTLYASVLIVPLIVWKLRTVLRIELAWEGWSPVLRRNHASHRERASERLDATTSWDVKIALIFSLLIFYYFIPDSLTTIISSLGPAEVINYASETHRSWAWYARLMNSFNNSFRVTGNLCQVLLNHKSRYFAGSYKAAIYITALKDVVELLVFVPAIVGTYRTRGPLTLFTIFATSIDFIELYQVLTLPAVGPIGPDEDEE